MEEEIWDNELWNFDKKKIVHCFQKVDFKDNGKKTKGHGAISSISKAYFEVKW